MIPSTPIRFDPDLPAAQDAGAGATVWYRTPSNALRAGYWTAGAGNVLRLVDHASEFCTLLDGVVRLTGADGHAQLFRRGESFVIPAGFTGLWETVETCRKFFVIHDDPGASHGV